MSEEVRMLTADQVAERLQVNRDVVYRLLKDGRLRGMMPGGRKTGWRVAEADLVRYVTVATGGERPPA